MTEPYLFERNLLGRADVFKTENKYSGVTIEATGFDLGAVSEQMGITVITLVMSFRKRKPIRLHQMLRLHLGMKAIS